MIKTGQDNSCPVFRYNYMLFDMHCFLAILITCHEKTKLDFLDFSLPPIHSVSAG